MKLGCIVMASGHSKRFQENKLLYPVRGVPMAQRVFMNLPLSIFSAAAVVSRSKEVLQIAETLGLTPVLNPDETDDTAVTIRLGLAAMPEGLDGCLFSVCDQPWLTPSSTQKLAEEWVRHPDHILRLSWNGVPGSPVIFPRAFFGELSTLPANQAGRYVLERHRDRVIQVDALSEIEMMDIDTKADLPE